MREALFGRFAEVVGLRWVARPCLTVAARLRRKHRAYTVPTERLRFAPLLLHGQAGERYAQLR